LGGITELTDGPRSLGATGNHGPPANPRSHPVPHQVPGAAQGRARVAPAASDVVIVGGGQSVPGPRPFGLQRQRVTNILVIDEIGAAREGPWGDLLLRMVRCNWKKLSAAMDLGLPTRELSTPRWFRPNTASRPGGDVPSLAETQWHRYFEVVSCNSRRACAARLPPRRLLTANVDGLLLVRYRGKPRAKACDLGKLWCWPPVISRAIVGPQLPELQIR